MLFVRGHQSIRMDANRFYSIIDRSIDTNGYKSSWMGTDATKSQVRHGRIRCYCCDCFRAVGEGSLGSRAMEERLTLIPKARRATAL